MVIESRPLMETNTNKELDGDGIKAQKGNPIADEELESDGLTALYGNPIPHKELDGDGLTAPKLTDAPNHWCKTLKDLKSSGTLDNTRSPKRPFPGIEAFITAMAPLALPTLHSLV
jgi:hypothetical protein